MPMILALRGGDRKKVQGHAQLYSVFKASLDHCESLSETKEKERKKLEFFWDGIESELM